MKRKTKTALFNLVRKSYHFYIIYNSIPFLHIIYICNCLDNNMKLGSCHFIVISINRPTLQISSAFAKKKTFSYDSDFYSKLLLL